MTILNTPPAATDYGKRGNRPRQRHWRHAALRWTQKGHSFVQNRRARVHEVCTKKRQEHNICARVYYMVCTEKALAKPCFTVRLEFRRAHPDFSAINRCSVPSLTANNTLRPTHPQLK